MENYNYRHRQATRKKVIFTFTSLLLLIIIFISSKNQNVMMIGSNAVGSVTSPFVKAIYFISAKAKEGVEQIFGSTKLRENYQKLLAENGELKEQVHIMEDVISREDALKTEYKLMQDSSQSLMMAYVSGKDPSNIFNRFAVDKGSLQGIHENDVIVEAVNNQKDIMKGLIGRVHQVGLNFSKVTTIIDENSNVSFRIQRTGETGILSGTAQKDLKGYLYNYEGDVIVGDKVFTSGLGGVYPRDIYIGEVTEVQLTEDGMTKNITVKSPVNFSKLYRVFILKNEGEINEQN